MRGNTTAHCGRRVRLPISTKSLTPVLSLDSTAAEPIDSRTIQMIPSATSLSLGVFWRTLPNNDAVACSGRPSRSVLQMSLICRLMCVMSPVLAISMTSLMWSVLSNRCASPIKVPPPMPMPPKCLMTSPSTLTSVVPVPIDTTVSLSRPLSKRAPKPSAWNSSALLVGRP